MKSKSLVVLFLVVCFILGGITATFEMVAEENVEEDMRGIQTIGPLPVRTLAPTIMEEVAEAKKDIETVGEPTENPTVIEPVQNVIVEDFEVEQAEGKRVFGLEVDPNATQGPIPQKSQEEIVAGLNRMVQESMLTISMNLNPVFADGQSKGELRIVNENNKPFFVEMYRTDTNELVYKSDVVPAGEKVLEDMLKVDLDAGVYDCVAYFNAINENGEVVGKVGANVELTVKG